MGLTTDDVRKVAHLARLAVDETELNAYAKELSSILYLVQQMDTIDTNKVAHMAHPRCASKGKQSRHPTIASSRFMELSWDADQRGVSQGNGRRAAGASMGVEDRVYFGDLDVPKSFTRSKTRLAIPVDEESIFAFRVTGKLTDANYQVFLLQVRHGAAGRLRARRHGGRTLLGEITDNPNIHQVISLTAELQLGRGLSSYFL